MKKHISLVKTWTAVCLAAVFTMFSTSQSLAAEEIAEVFLTQDQQLISPEKDMNVDVEAAADRLYGIKFYFDSRDLDIGKTKTLTCKAYYDATSYKNNTGGKVVSPTWSVISNTYYRGSASISSGGVLTGKRTGTVIVKASYTENGVTETASCDMYIHGPVSLSITTDASNNTVMRGSTINCICTVKYDTGISKILTPNWSIDSGSSCASITAGGILTGKAYGSPTVKASYTEGETTVNGTLTVYVDELDSITISGASSVYVGDTVHYSCTAKYRRSNNKVVNASWSIKSGGSYASITSDGALTGLKDGSAYIKATYTEGGVTRTAETHVWVNKVTYPVTYININGIDSVMKDGTATYTCIATRTDGSSSSVTPTWSITSGGGSASISSGGVLTGTGAGMIILKAAYAGKTAEKSITIIDVGAVAPSITMQPKSQTVNEWDTVTFSVTASGTAPLKYQWKKNGTPISGATSSSYTISSVKTSDAGNYAVTVSNSAGDVTSSVATLTVNASAKPSIMMQPKSQTVNEGSSATFSVTASGTAPLKYQWKKDGYSISGATNSSYTISSVKTGDAGNYAVTVSNNGGSVTSSAATLTVMPITLSSISISGNSSVKVGATTTYTCKATYSNGTTKTVTPVWNVSPIACASISSGGVLTGEAAGTVEVKASYSEGGVTKTATMSVTVSMIKPSITIQPKKQTVDEGSSVTFSVTASGTAPLNYQWKKGGVNISGATNSSYTINSAWKSDEGSYTVTVSNSAGSVTSSAVTLTVIVPISSISISGSSNVNVGAKATYICTVTYNNGTTETVKPSWSISSGTSYASITSGGVLTGKRPGPVTVKASYTVGGVNQIATKAVTVRMSEFAVKPVIDSDPESQTVNEGDSVSFSVAMENSDMVWINSGTFMMGSPNTELGRHNSEGQHQVKLTQGYWIGKYEVTQAQYEAIMETNPSAWKGADHPVEKVSWNAATNFCAKLTAIEKAAGRLPDGYAYTLPTEAQWEYACRAGTTTALNSGKNLTTTNECYNLNEVGWYLHNSSNTTHSVGQKLPNNWGLYDMHGNVWEWCLDWSGGYPVSSVADPAGPSTGEYRIIRGGAWDIITKDCRSAYRSACYPEGRFSNIGLRVILSPVQSGSGGNYGNVSLTYQWYKDGKAISGATGPSYTIKNVKASDAGKYTVKVSNSVGSVTSSAATLTVDVPVTLSSITISGSSSVNVGGTATYTCKASYSDGATKTVTPTWSISSGASYASITSGGVLTGKAAGTVTVKATYTEGGVTKTATKSVTVNAVAVKPSITTQPKSQTVSEGKTVTFSVVAEGGNASTSGYPETGYPGCVVDQSSATKYLNYQVQSSGFVVMPTYGPTTLKSFQMTTANDKPERDPVSYQIYGSNDEITYEDLQAMDNTAGDQNNWTLIAEGELSLPDERQAMGDIIPVSNDISYTAYKVIFPSVKDPSEGHMQLADIQFYEVESPDPDVDLGFLCNSDVDYTIAVGSGSSLAYQWYKDDKAISGAKDSSYTIKNVKASDAGKYTVKVSNNAGSVTSSAATLTVVKNKLTPRIIWNPVSPITYGTPLSEDQLNAVAVGPDGEPVDGSYIYTVDSTLPSVGVHTLYVAFIPFDSNYEEVTASVTVTVTAPVTLSSITISGSSSVDVGSTATYTCKAKYSDGTTKTVKPTWSISSGGSYASITSGGVLTGKAAGTAKVKASYTEDGVTKTATKSVTVNESFTYHPADTNKDKMIKITEVTAYAKAWKSGETWSVGPNPIDISYLTRAGALWKGGESYTQDATQEAPMCWVNELTLPVSTMPFNPIIDFPIVILEPEAEVEAASDSAVYSTISGETVTITVTPEACVSVYAVEDTLPSGWTVTGINENGVFDSVNHKVKWGPWFDNSPRTLTYTLVIPDDFIGTATLNGTASFDGVDTTIAGDRDIRILGDSPDALSIRKESDGTTVTITFTGTLQESTDMKSWKNVNGTQNGTYTFTPEKGMRFYRAMK